MLYYCHKWYWFAILCNRFLKHKKGQKNWLWMVGRPTDHSRFFPEWSVGWPTIQVFFPEWSVGRPTIRVFFLNGRSIDRPFEFFSPMVGRSTDHSGFFPEWSATVGSTAFRLVFEWSTGLVDHPRTIPSRTATPFWVLPTQCTPSGR